MAKQKLTKKDSQKAAKALEVLFTTDYVSKSELYKQNFIRGLFFSIGTIVGATILLGFGVWVLSLVNEVPVIGPAAETIQRSIENYQK